jgi:hypothetical protein
MITVIVEFKLPQRLTREQAKEMFQSTAPKYKGMPGLLRKYYFLSQDGMKAGGIYLWQSRQAADSVYTDAWRGAVREKYGAEPSLIHLECPVVVDNVADTITLD